MVDLALVDLVAERAQQLRGLLQRRAVLGVQLRQRRGRQLARDRDPQGRRDPVPDPSASRNELGGTTGCAGVRRTVGDRVVEQGAVAHRARQHAVDAQAVPGVHLRRQRHPPALGLQPEQAAVGRRKADRSSAVARQRGAHQAGGDRRRAAAARAAGAVLQLPRVARHPPRRGLGPGERAQLGHVRLADHDRPRRARAAHDLRVRARGLAVGVRAERRHLAGDVEFVLDRDRHAQQRALAVPRAAPSVGLVGFQSRPLREHDPEGVQLGVVALDPLQVDVHQLARR